MNETELKQSAREGGCEQEKEQYREQLLSEIAQIQDVKALRCLRTLRYDRTRDFS